MFSGNESRGIRRTPSLHAQATSSSRAPAATSSPWCCIAAPCRPSPRRPFWRQTPAFPRA